MSEAPENENIETPETPVDEAAPEPSPEADPTADEEAPAEAEPAAEAEPEPAAEAEPTEPEGAPEPPREPGPPPRPPRSAEQRQAERDLGRTRKAAARRRRRPRERERAKGRRAASVGQAAPPREHGPGRPRVRQGVVTSDKADKTITVRIDVARRHMRYEKIVRSSSSLHAHDESNDANVGDTVRVVESRPLSATKRWRLLEVLERAR